MAKQKLLAAVLCGAGFVSVTVLLLNVSSAGSAFLLLLLEPGGIVAHFLAGSGEFDPPALILATNALLYSGVAYAVISIFSRRLAANTIHLATISLLFPVGVLVGLICIPSLNPLWPHDMAELARQEQGLQDALPVGMEMSGARALLRSKGIQFHEETEASQTVVLKRQDRSITASAGDRIISARVETDARQFPCGYDIEVVLLFAPDERLKDQFIHRIRLCP